MGKAGKTPKRPAGVGPEAVWSADFALLAEVPVERVEQLKALGGYWREGDFWFDERAADKAAAFFPTHLRLTEGEWAGQPFHLEPWEEDDIIRPLFGWKRSDSTRRYRRCFVWVARKNGKTELAAGIALLMLVGDAEPGGQVFSIASEKDQAAIVFGKASNMVARSTTLAGLAGLETFKESIYCPQLNASMRPLSGKPQGKHGLNMSGLIGDEIHEWRSGELYTFVHDSAGARRQPLEFLISTAGVRGGYGEEVWDECQAIRAGDIDDPSTMVVIYAADAEDDWTDPAVWKKANPNFGVSVKPDAFRAEFNRARQLPRLENDFRRYRLNMWTDQMVRWLPIDGIDDEGRHFGWDHCAGDRNWAELEEDLRHRTCYGGLDLSSTNDLSALIWWFPAEEPGELPAVLARFFKPADLIDVHTRRDRVPYRQYVKDGALYATPGNVIDYAFIREQVYQDAERFKVAFSGAWKREPSEGGLAIDRWNATQTAIELEQEGIPVVMFGQGFASMSAPSKELERLVMANGFRHGGHPVLRRHAQAAAVQTDPAGNIKPAKDRSLLRIDGIVALVMALGIAAHPDNAPVVDVQAMVA